ncbi:toprim domain-containing protein [Methylomonas sp. SURF-2]|uniref:Toprim domain-containing protein n=1 Tax=Methylomonas subterranea TaxID=2952225 RepID=A0ABT1TDL4_9GAMM|nr:toprim domain-containing protein [Methylomonas sp. SURF-2]MCQ8103542.1 toprim domain-containing protein [Methylomonas sp. SURF-2]
MTNYQNLEDAARAGCAAIGVEFKHVPSDGRWHCADLADDPRGKNDGRIKLFPDGQGGMAWNHKTGEKQSFFVDRHLSREEREADRERIEAERQRRQAKQKQRADKTAKRAAALWQAANPAAADHSYLLKKHIQPHGARVGTWKRTIKNAASERQTIAIPNTLLIPMHDATGTLRSLQGIFPGKHPLFERDKDFLAGGGLAGLFWWLGTRSEKVLICEGFATAATLFEETGLRTYIAFTANNLLAVGRIVRERLPKAEIVFCADNDSNTDGNPGLTKAEQAAVEVDGLVAIPPIAGDFNDMAITLHQETIDDRPL